MNHDVFISYSSKNSKTAQAICHLFEENGVRCWMAPRDIPMGSKYAAVISQAIKGCKAVVLVFSEQSAISPWVESEINIAFSNHKPIFPYKIDKAVLANYDAFYLMLNNRHWIDSYPDFRSRFDELVQTVGKYVGVDVQQKNPEPHTPHTPKPRRWWLWALIAALVVVVGALLLGGSGEQGRRTKEKAEAERIAQERRADSLARVVEAERHRSDSLAIMAQRLEKENNVRTEAERKAAEKAEQDRLAKEKAKKECIAKEQQDEPSVWLDANERELKRHMGIIEGYEYVDLGLSVLWATCNLGATKPSDKGSYCWISNSEDKIKGGIVENDVVSSVWSPSWCLPTNEEWNELAEKCEWVKGTLDNSEGWWITGPSGASIWLPVGGCVNILGEMMHEGSCVYYSGTVSSYKLQNYVFMNDGIHRGIDKEGRLYMSQKLVRPVVSKKAMKLEQIKKIKKNLEELEETAKENITFPTFGLG